MASVLANAQMAGGGLMSDTSPDNSEVNLQLQNMLRLIEDGKALMYFITITVPILNLLAIAIHFIDDEILSLNSLIIICSLTVIPTIFLYWSRTYMKSRLTNRLKQIAEEERD